MQGGGRRAPRRLARGGFTISGHDKIIQWLWLWLMFAMAMAIENGISWDRWWNMMNYTCLLCGGKLVFGPLKCYSNFPLYRGRRGTTLKIGFKNRHGFIVYGRWNMIGEEYMGDIWVVLYARRRSNVYMLCYVMSCYVMWMSCYVM